MRLPVRPAFYMSAAYFAFYAGIACWSPYIVLYYAALGFSGLQIGVLNAILPIGMAVFAPLWSSLADSRSLHRLVLRIALLATAIAMNRRKAPLHCFSQCSFAKCSFANPE